MRTLSALLCILVGLRWALAQVFQPPQVTVVEGERILIPCSQNATSHDSMYWYQQPQQGWGALSFLGMGYKDSSAAGEFTMVVDPASRSTNLTRDRARLREAGTYYCAVARSTNDKFIFGSGTQLTVVPKLDNSPPSIYPLTSDNKNLLACLVTDFFPGNISVGSRPNAKLTSLNASLVVMKGSGEASYGTVLWGPRDELACTADHDNQNFQLTDFDEEDDTCMIVEMDENFETDKNLNFLSLTLLGLRIVFVKTVAINLLLTLSQWKR